MASKLKKRKARQRKRDKERTRKIKENPKKVYVHHKKKKTKKQPNIYDPFSEEGFGFALASLVKYQLMKNRKNS